MWPIVYVVAALAVAYGCVRWSRRKMYALAANLSGPMALPLLGHTYMLLGKGSPEGIFKIITDYGQKYVSPIGIWGGPKLYVALTGKPEHFQVALNSPHMLDKLKQYEFFRVVRGLFASPASLWKSQRKMLNRSFNPTMLNSFVTIFNDKDLIFVDKLAKYVGKGEVNIHSDIGKCFLDTIFATAFGVDCDTQNQEGPVEYLEALDTFMSIAFKRIFAVHHHPEFVYRFTQDYQTEKKALNTIRSLSSSIIDEQIKQFKKMRDYTRDDVEMKPAQNFLENLYEIAAKNAEFSELDLKDNIDTIIAAGHDTTATTIGNLVLMLAIHQDVQDAMYREIMEVCPDRSMPVTMEDAAKLHYTEMVCKETMRLFPVGPIIAREAVADIKLDDKVTIPAGTGVGLAFYFLHRDPKIWGPEADQFNPNHFLPENSAKRHPYAYLPFSGGPRNCIGVRYAWLSMKIMIVHLLRNYRFKTSLTMATLNFRFALIFRITNGILVSIENR